MVEVTDIPLISAPELAALISRARVDLARESAIQAELELYLAARLPLGCALRREFVLGPGDRPDFLVDGRIAVECKAQRASAAASLMQLKRYAAHDRIEALILVTNKAMSAPATVGGKPLFAVSLGRAWL